MREKILKIFKGLDDNEAQSSTLSFAMSSLGPVFMMFTLTLFTAKGALPLIFLSSAATAGYFLSWIYQLKGVFYSAGLWLLCLSFCFFAQLQEFPLFFSTVASLSFLASFYLTGLSSASQQQALTLLKKEHEQKIHTLEATYTTNQRFFEKQLEQSQQEIKQQDKVIKNQEKEMVSFKQLMIACKEESDHFYHLSDQYKQKMRILENKLGDLELTNREKVHLQEENVELLKKLNNSRVQSFEYELIAFNELARQKTNEEKTYHQVGEISQELDQLVSQRKELKKIYDDKLRDYRGISEKIEMMFLNQGTSKIDLSTTELIMKTFEEVGQDLQDVRLNILKIEEGILHLKKELKISHEEGLSPGSYLAVADQECLRLEEQNSLLLRLLSQLIDKTENPINQKTLPYESF